MVSNADAGPQPPAREPREGGGRGGGKQPEGNGGSGGRGRAGRRLFVYSNSLHLDAHAHVHTGPPGLCCFLRVNHVHTSCMQDTVVNG